LKQLGRDRPIGRVDAAMIGMNPTMVHYYAREFSKHRLAINAIKKIEDRLAEQERGDE
jgi:hypothetical protein